MLPTDIRDQTWDEIRGRITGQRLAVYEGYRAHGPCTTLHLASRICLSGYTVRPRTTELFQVGLVRLVGRDRGQGIYAAVTIEEARREHERRAQAKPEQMLMTYG